MPASTSSRTTPQPPGRLWAMSTGPGFQMSKRRNSRKGALRRAAHSSQGWGCRVTVNSSGVRANHIPAHSSMTMQEGSFCPVSRTTASAAHTATRVSARGAASSTQGVQEAGKAPTPHTSSSQTSRPASVPQVPGAGRRYPLPKPVASHQARRGAGVEGVAAIRPW